MVTRVQQPVMKSLFLLNTQILPGGFGNTTYRIRAGEGKSKEGGIEAGEAGACSMGGQGRSYSFSGCSCFFSYSLSACCMVAEGLAFTKSYSLAFR